MKKDSIILAIVYIVSLIVIAVDVFVWGKFP